MEEMRWMCELFGNVIIISEAENGCNYLTGKEN